MDNIDYDQLFHGEPEKNEADTGQRNSDAVTEETAASEQPELDKPVQTQRERARQAEGRRRREAEAAGRRAAREEISAALARAGWRDRTTGAAVDDVDKLLAYDAKLRQDRSPLGPRPVRGDSPAPASERPPVTGTAEDPRIRQELEQIRALDPEMTDLGAIIRSEAGQRFREYVRRGLDFLDAYKLAAEERLASLRQGRAAEAARLRAASKDHLSGTKTQGTGAAAVPRDVEANYRVFFPDASAADIQRMYNADLKKYGRK